MPGATSSGATTTSMASFTASCCAKAYFPASTFPTRHSLQGVPSTLEETSPDASTTPMELTMHFCCAMDSSRKLITPGQVPPWAVELTMQATSQEIRTAQGARGASSSGMESSKTSVLAMLTTCGWHRTTAKS